MRSFASCVRRRRLDRASCRRIVASLTRASSHMRPVARVSSGSRQGGSRPRGARRGPPAAPPPMRRPAAAASAGGARAVRREGGLRPSTSTSVVALLDPLPRGSDPTRTGASRRRRTTVRRRSGRAARGSRQGAAIVAGVKAGAPSSAATRPSTGRPRPPRPRVCAEHRDRVLDGRAPDDGDLGPLPRPLDAVRDRVEGLACTVVDGSVDRSGSSPGSQGPAARPGRRSAYGRRRASAAARRGSLGASGPGHARRL